MLTGQLTAVVVRELVRPVSAVVGLVAHLPLTDAASVPTLELIGSTWRTLCGEIQHDDMPRETTEIRHPEKCDEVRRRALHLISETRCNIPIWLFHLKSFSVRYSCTRL